MIPLWQLGHLVAILAYFSLTSYSTWQCGHLKPIITIYSSLIISNWKTNSSYIVISNLYQALPIDLRYFLVFRRPSVKALACTLVTLLPSSSATSSVLILRKIRLKCLISSFVQIVLFRLAFFLAIFCSPDK